MIFEFNRSNAVKALEEQNVQLATKQDELTILLEEKEYIATLKLGATTPSFDLESEEDATYPIEHITRELIDEILKQMTFRYP